jgi:5-methylcytosine-specific restriction endonuclease McrA
MSRATDEWIGRNDDTPIPPRVKARIFDRDGKHCKVCTNPISGSRLPAYDHVVALINGGENRETNIQLLCVDCHKPKTAADVREKSIVARKRMKFLGIAPKKGRPMPGSKESGFRKRMDGTVERR